MRIDNDLMTELKARAHQQSISLTRMLNRVIRQGLAASSQRAKPQKKFQEVPVSMGEARVDIGQALTLAADLEGEEIIRKLSLRR